MKFLVDAQLPNVSSVKLLYFCASLALQKNGNNENLKYFYIRP